jgi:hypothetical protein
MFYTDSCFVEQILSTDILNAFLYTECFVSSTSLSIKSIQFYNIFNSWDPDIFRFFDT